MKIRLSTYKKRNAPGVLNCSNENRKKKQEAGKAVTRVHRNSVPGYFPCRSRQKGGVGMINAHVNNYLVFHDNRDGTITAVDYFTGQEYVMDADTAHVLRKMDGTRPLAALFPMNSRECEELVGEWLEMGVLRKNRMEIDAPGFVRIALWMSTGRLKAREKKRAVIFHRLVQLLWLPLLVSGILVWGYFFINELQYGDINVPDYISIAGILAGLVTGVFLHELSHAACGAVYGASLFEIGIGLSCFLPCGYVLMDESGIRRRIQKAGVALAGIKMNLLLAGCCLLLRCLFLFAWQGVFFARFAYINMFLALLNLSLWGSSDGFGALTELLGIPREWSLKDWILILLGRKKLRRVRGIHAEVFRIAILLMLVFRAEILLVIGFEIWNIFYLLFG